MSAAAQAARLAALSSTRAIGYNIKAINLLPVKQVKVTFNPFYKSVQSARDILFILSMPKVKRTNPNTTVRSDVKSDKTLPTMEVLFTNGKKALFKTENLSTVEVTTEFNKLCQVYLSDVAVDKVDFTADKKKKKK